MAATSDEGELTAEGALPYPVSQLDRTLAFLTSRPTIRVPEDIQRFVDDTYQPMTPDEMGAAGREVGIASLKISSAVDSASRLTRLLSVEKRLHWQHLTDITNQHDADELMRTRYIDRPGLTFLLIDSRPAADRSNWALTDHTALSPYQRQGRTKP
ncbi:MAG: hypothetical protein WKF76_02250 [Nocardioidaceae bacterium]